MRKLCLMIPCLLMACTTQHQSPSDSSAYAPATPVAVPDTTSRVVTGATPTALLSDSLVCDVPASSLRRPQDYEVGDTVACHWHQK